MDAASVTIFVIAILIAVVIALRVGKKKQGPPA